MKARFLQQGVTVDYIPAADVKAGSIVTVNDLVGVSRYDIKAGELGSLAVAPAPVFEVEKGASVAFAFGAKVYWDTANAKTAAAAGTGIVLLKANVDADAGRNHRMMIRWPPVASSPCNHQRFKPATLPKEQP